MWQCKTSLLPEGKLIDLFVTAVKSSQIKMVLKRKSSFLSFCTLFLLVFAAKVTNAAKNEEATPSEKRIYTWDPNGYVMFCLCMGRFGNQADHFLGSMDFAKSLNRTLILPQFRFHQHHRYSELFKLEAIEQYHRVIESEDFMEQLAPTHWPPGERIAMCYQPPNSEVKSCRMKEGVPFKPYWDGLGIDFDRDELYHIGYYPHDLGKWQKQYPPNKFPVYAMRGAPASFPIQAQHRQLQHYMEFSDGIRKVGDNYISENFPGEKYIGLHLRNGVDWQRACDRVDNVPSFMASPQCLDGTGKKVTKKLCLPSNNEVLRLVKNVVIQTRAKNIFVATDRFPLTKEIEEHLKSQKVKVFHMDPDFPLHDIYLLTRADHFIGNCVSSFTAFVKRHRDAHNLGPTSFFGFS